MLPIKVKNRDTKSAHVFPPSSRIENKTFENPDTNVNTWRKCINISLSILEILSILEHFVES